MKINWKEIFSKWPDEIRENIEKSFNEIRQRYFESNFEPSELNGGKFCESVFRLLEWEISGQYRPFGQKIEDFKGTITKMCSNKKDKHDSIRFHIPSALISIYDVRNRRGVGHVGGDVNPNRMDSEYILAVSSWVMAELVRLYHNVSLSEAQNIVEELVETKIPLVWKIGDKYRVLLSNLTARDKTILVLFSMHPNPTTSKSLKESVEYTNITNFRKNILKVLHRKKLIEYDEKRDLVFLSPLGVKEAQKIIVNNLNK